MIIIFSQSKYSFCMKKKKDNIVWLIEWSTTCVLWLILLLFSFILFRSINVLPTTPRRPNNNAMLESTYIHTIRKREWIKVCERITTRSSSPLLWWERRRRRKKTKEKMRINGLSWLVCDVQDIELCTNDLELNGSSNECWWPSFN